jgi:hypothetical protein
MSSRHYINNRTLFEALVKYKTGVDEAKANGTTPPRIPEYIGECFYKIATRLSTKYKYVNYTFRDEMIADAIENCVAAVNNFDPSKSNNPFAYFTQIIGNAFIRRIMKEKKQTYVKYKYMQKMMADGALASQQEMDEVKDIDTSFANMDKVNDLIRDYETYMHNTREKSRKAKKGIEKFIGDEEKNEDSPDNGHSLGNP